MHEHACEQSTCSHVTRMHGHMLESQETQEPQAVARTKGS